MLLKISKLEFSNINDLQAIYKPPDTLKMLPSGHSGFVFGLEIHNLLLEVFAVDGLVAHPVAVGVDGVDRVVEYLRYAGALRDAEFHQRVDSQLEGQSLLRHLRGKPFFGTEQKVDLLDEIGEISTKVRSKYLNISSSLSSV